MAHDAGRVGWAGPAERELFARGWSDLELRHMSDVRGLNMFAYHARSSTFASALKAAARRGVAVALGALAIAIVLLWALSGAQLIAEPRIRLERPFVFMANSCAEDTRMGCNAYYVRRPDGYDVYEPRQAKVGWLRLRWDQRTKCDRH
jgi:hypothetical protein